MAYGILHLRGRNGWAGWRYLFLIEGCISKSNITLCNMISDLIYDAIVAAVIGFISLLWLPPSPTETKGSIRGKDGWFTEREEIIMVNRIIRDDPSKG
jgi:hypothetical protein